MPCQSILSGGSPLSYYSDDDENWATVVSDTICSSRKRYWELRRQHAPHVLEVVAATSEGKQENFENEEELPLNLTTAAKSLSQLCDNSETVSSHWDGDPLTAEEGTDWHNWHDSMKIVQVLYIVIVNSYILLHIILLPSPLLEHESMTDCERMYVPDYLF